MRGARDTQLDVAPGRHHLQVDVVVALPAGHAQHVRARPQPFDAKRAILADGGDGRVRAPFARCGHHVRRRHAVLVDDPPLQRYRLFQPQLHSVLGGTRDCAPIVHPTDQDAVAAGRLDVVAPGRYVGLERAVREGRHAPLVRA